MFLFNIIAYSVIVIPYTLSYIRKFKLTPVSIFLIMQMTFFYGICFSELGRTATVLKLETLYVVANAMFIFGTVVSRVLRKKGSRTPLINTFTDKEDTDLQRLILWVIAIVAVLVCAYLFISSGVNVFVESLKSFASGTNENMQDDRAEFRGVSGMGYIYQFRVVLLPLIATYFAMVSKKKYNKLITVPLIVLMIIFILGTGQRNAFVFYCLIVVMLVWHMHREYKINIMSKTQAIVLGGSALLFLVVLTISNGRVEEGNDNIVVGALQSLYDRVFSVNQGSAITAFRYIDSQETVWGYDWIQMLKQALPGESDYLPVDNIAYYMDYGTYKGTNPPCLWGSAWYNFSYIGVTVFPFILGIIYHNIYKNYVVRSDKGRAYVLIYVALCVYLGIWSYGTPMTLLNNGVITVLILRWLLFSLFKKRTEVRK